MLHGMAGRSANRTWKKTVPLPARGPLQMPGALKPNVVEAHAMELIKSMLYLADTMGQSLMLHCKQRKTCVSTLLTSSGHLACLTYQTLCWAWRITESPSPLPLSPPSQPPLAPLPSSRLPPVPQPPQSLSFCDSARSLYNSLTVVVTSCVAWVLQVREQAAHLTPVVYAKHFPPPLMFGTFGSV